MKPMNNIQKLLSSTVISFGLLVNMGNTGAFSVPEGTSEEEHSANTTLTKPKSEAKGLKGFKQMLKEAKDLKESNKKAFEELQSLEKTVENMQAVAKIESTLSEFNADAHKAQFNKECEKNDKKLCILDPQRYPILPFYNDTKLTVKTAIQDDFRVFHILTHDSNIRRLEKEIIELKKISAMIENAKKKEEEKKGENDKKILAGKNQDAKKIESDEKERNTGTIQEQQKEIAELKEEDKNNKKKIQEQETEISDLKGEIAHLKSIVDQQSAKIDLLVKMMHQHFPVKTSPVEEENAASKILPIPHGED